MLEGLFGNRTVENVLLFLAMNKEAYAQEMSDRLGVPLNMVQAQLRRLERGGIIVGQSRGRMRFYSFNPRFPLADDLTGMLRRAVDYLPDSDREKLVARRRPRARDKP
jgi:DNA-binding transcriptional ArsR family regulator